MDSSATMLRATEWLRFQRGQSFRLRTHTSGEGRVRSTDEVHEVRNGCAQHVSNRRL